MATDYDFPEDLLAIRRRFDTAHRDLVRLHAEYDGRPDDEGYRAQVGELRERQREAVRELYAHPWPETAEDGPAVARMALQQRVAAELVAEEVAADA